MLIGIVLLVIVVLAAGAYYRDVKQREERERNE
jgi:hypothetical protein